MGTNLLSFWLYCEVNLEFERELCSYGRHHDESRSSAVPGRHDAAHRRLQHPPYQIPRHAVRGELRQQAAEDVRATRPTNPPDVRRRVGMLVSGLPELSRSEDGQGLGRVVCTRCGVSAGWDAG